MKYVNDFSTGQLFSFQRNSGRLKRNRTTGRLCSLPFGLDSTNGKIVEHRVLSERQEVTRVCSTGECNPSRITFFDVVLEESGNAGREYRYSTAVSHEISSMAEPFDDKRTLARRGWKSKCVHPVRQKGDEFDQLMGLEPMSINRQTRSSKPMAIPIPLTLFARRLFYRRIEFFSSCARNCRENTAFTVGMKYVFSKDRSFCRFHFQPCFFCEVTELSVRS